MASQVGMEVRDMVDIYVTGRKQITNIYIKIDDYTRDLLDSYIAVRQDVIVEDTTLKVAPDQLPTYELSLDLTLEDSNEKVNIENCSNKCPGDIVVGIRCLNAITRITKGDGGLKIPAKTMCSPTHFKLGTKEVLKFTGNLRVTSLNPNGRSFHGTFSVFTKSSFKKRKETMMMDSWNLGLERKGLGDAKKKRRLDKDSPSNSPSSPHAASPLSQHQLYSKTIPVFTSKAVLVPPSGPHHTHTQMEIRGFNSGGGSVNLLWKEGDNIMIIEPIDMPSESKLVFSTPYGRPGLLIEVWIRVDGSYFIGDSQGNPFKFTFDYSPDPALNEVLKIVQNLEKSVMHLSEGKVVPGGAPAQSQANGTDDRIRSELEKQMEDLNEVRKKTSQLAQYGTFMQGKEEQEKPLFAKEPPRLPAYVPQIQIAQQAEVLRMAAPPQPIALNLDDIVTLEVKPTVKSVRFLNINISDDIKDLFTEGPAGLPLVQIDESLLEPGTKHLNTLTADYKFSMSIHKDNEAEQLEVSTCVEPNCEGRLLKKCIAVIPTHENIVRMGRRSSKLQLPLLFYCSALHFNGEKFTVKVQINSTKPYKPSFLGMFSVWTTEKYMERLGPYQEQAPMMIPNTISDISRSAIEHVQPVEAIEIDNKMETQPLIIAQ